MDFGLILLFALATIGMTHIIIDGSVLQWFRDGVKSFAGWLAEKTGRQSLAHLGDVVDCYLCCGTWCGFLMGLIFISYNPFKVFACGMAGGFLANFAATFLNYLEARTIVSLNDSSPAPKDEEAK